MSALFHFQQKRLGARTLREEPRERRPYLKADKDRDTHRMTSQNNIKYKKIVGCCLCWASIKFVGVAIFQKQYSSWRIDPNAAESGRSLRNIILGAVLVGAIGPLIVYKFTVNSSLALLDSFPEQRVSELILGKGNGTLFSRFANWMEGHIERAAVAGGDFFDGIVTTVPVVLDALTLALNGSPWPVVMLVICVTAWRAAGPRVAIFTATALAYIALLGDCCGVMVASATDDAKV